MGSDESSDAEVPCHESDGDSLAFELLDEDYPFKHLLTTNKAPSTEEEKVAHRQISGSNQRLESIRKRIQRLQWKIWDLEDQEAEEERRNGSYQRIFAPIRRIPDEMLGEIFKHLHSVDEGFPLSISLVCSHWRQVILKTPRLWTTIRIFPTLNSIELAKILAKRCGPTLPMRITMQNWGKPEDRSFELSWLAPYRPRIQKLAVSVFDDIRYRHPSRRFMGLPVIKGDSFDVLEELELNVEDENWENIRFSLWKASTKADSLRRLRLVNLGLPPTDIGIHVNRLTHLSLEVHFSGNVQRWDVRQVLKFLADYPQLQFVKFMNVTDGYGMFGTETEFTAGLPGPRSLSRLDPSQYPSAESERITLPNLTSLSIDFEEGTTWFLERLTLPGLKHLELRGAVYWAHAFRDMVERSACSLESFTMIRCTPFFGHFGAQHHPETEGFDSHETRQEQAITVLKSSPAIRMFKVVDSLYLGSYLVEWLGRKDDDESLIGPNLQHLWVSDTEEPRQSGLHIGSRMHAGREKILQMLASRQTGGQEAEKSGYAVDFRVYHSGHPSIPVSVMSLQEVYDRYQGHNYETSRHIFF